MTRSAAELIADIDHAGGPEAFADLVGNRGRTSTRNGILKAEAVYAAGSALVALGISTTPQLRERHADTTVEAAWRGVTGQRSGISWHYLLILAGVEDIKADRMIRRFVEGPSPSRRIGAEEAHATLLAVAEVLREDVPDLSLRALDHAIWRHQRRR